MPMMPRASTRRATRASIKLTPRWEDALLFIVRIAWFGRRQGQAEAFLTVRKRVPAVKQINWQLAAAMPVGKTSNR